MIGKSIKHFREKANISVEKLGELTNLTRQSIYNYEKDKREPSLGIIAGLSKILKFNLLISEGEIMVISNENKTIKEAKMTLNDIKERFVNQFKYTQNIFLDELFGTTIDMFENEYNCNVLWHHFGCDIDFDKVNDMDIYKISKEKIKEFFKNPDNFSYWTFEVITPEEVFMFSINFKMRNKEVFTSYVNDYIDSEYFDLEAEREREDDFNGIVYEILRTITYCENDITKHLIVGDIKITDKLYG